MNGADHQINEDRAFQAGFWWVQRLAWGLLTVLLAAALLGLTGGSGRFARQTVGDDAFTIRYPAIMRQQTEATFDAVLSRPASKTMLHLDSAFLDAFDIIGMTPPPASAFATPRGVAYRFARSGPGSITIHIAVSARWPTIASYAIVADGRMALLSTTVLP